MEKNIYYNKKNINKYNNLKLNNNDVLNNNKNTGKIYDDLNDKRNNQTKKLNNYIQNDYNKYINNNNIKRINYKMEENDYNE